MKRLDKNILNRLNTKHHRCKSQEDKEYFMTYSQVPRLKPKKNMNPLSPMSLYYKSFRNIQRNKFLLEKISFLKEDIDFINNDHDDYYISCPEKGDLENSFSTDETEACTTLHTNKKNNTPFSSNKSLKRLLNLNECGMKEYSLECEDITPTAKDILEKNNFLDFNSPKKTPLKSSNKSLFSKKNLFISHNESEGHIQSLFNSESFNEKKMSILSLMETKTILK